MVGVSGGDTEQIGVLQNLATLTVGIAAWAGIVHYGLYDTRVVLSRSITYGLLLATVLAVYASVTVALRAVLGEVTSAALATALAVVVALPLRSGSPGGCGSGYTGCATNRTPRSRGSASG